MDPARGRFLAVDPLLGAADDPATLHRYLYAGDDPVQHDDPSGQQLGLIDTGMASAEAMVERAYGGGLVASVGTASTTAVGQIASYQLWLMYAYLGLTTNTAAVGVVTIGAGITTIGLFAVSTAQARAVNLARQTVSQSRQRGRALPTYFVSVAFSLGNCGYYITAHVTQAGSPDSRAFQPCQQYAAHVFDAANSGQFPSPLAYAPGGAARRPVAIRGSGRCYDSSGQNPDYVAVSTSTFWNGSSRRECDEYPFASTQQSSGLSDLLWIDADENRRGGTDLNYFYQDVLFPGVPQPWPAGQDFNVVATG